MKKEKLRSVYLAKRKELNKQEVEKKSNLIFDIIENNFILKNKKISLFLTIEKLNEINTFSFLKKVLTTCKLIATPRSDFKLNELIHVKFKSLDQLKTSEFGIPESEDGEIIQPEDFDIVFVPLLTIDKSGNRVGYGKGFYDRFLSKCKPECIFIGIYIFEEIEEIEDVNCDDIKLNYCITPTKIITF